MPSEERNDARQNEGVSESRDNEAGERFDGLPGDNNWPLIVGVGCSAGGVEACRDLFALMPRIDDVAFVLVQHLDPDHDSAMSELLGAVTSLTVEEAEDAVVPRGGYLYTIPADRYPRFGMGACDF